MMSNSSSGVLRIVTRKSPLALWQAYYVKDLLEKAHQGLIIEIEGLLTEGDKLLATPLAEIGGKGLFVKELEKAIIERRADIAVHSIKDMPAELPDRMVLGAICRREDPRDVFVSNRYASLEDLPAGAVVGTSSSRRLCLLKAYAPQVKIEHIRGNVGTRLQKLDEGQFDAIILAAAGLIRLGEPERIRQFLDPAQWIPAIGQGAVGVECHKENHFALDCLAAIDDALTRYSITAERAMNQALGGGCQFPIAAHAVSERSQLFIRGMVGDKDNDLLIEAQDQGGIEEGEAIGRRLAEQLIDKGAREILARYQMS